jgi:hypothetical protein
LKFSIRLDEKNENEEDERKVAGEVNGVTDNGAEDPDPDRIQVVVEGDSGDDSGRRSANRRGKKSKESESKDEVKKLLFFKVYFQGPFDISDIGTQYDDKKIFLPQISIGKGLAVGDFVGLVKTILLKKRRTSDMTTYFYL